MNMIEQIFKNFRILSPVAWSAVILRVFDFIYFRREYSKVKNAVRLIISSLIYVFFHFIFCAVYSIVHIKVPYYFMNHLYSGCIYLIAESVICLISTFLCGIIDRKLIKCDDKQSDNFKQVKINSYINALTNVIYVIMFLGSVALYQLVLSSFENTKELAHYFLGSVIVPSIALLLIVVSIKRFITADLFEEKKSHPVWYILFSIGVALVVFVIAFFLIKIS